jgi:hypothetical protein
MEKRGVHMTEKNLSVADSASVQSPEGTVKEEEKA